MRFVQVIRPILILSTNYPKILIPMKSLDHYYSPSISILVYTKQDLICISKFKLYLTNLMHIYHCASSPLIINGFFSKKKKIYGFFVKKLKIIIHDNLQLLLLTFDFNLSNHDNKIRFTFHLYCKIFFGQTVKLRQKEIKYFTLEILVKHFTFYNFSCVEITLIDQPLLTLSRA